MKTGQAGGFCPTNPDLANILGRTDSDFEKFLLFVDLLDSKIPDFQFPRFPDSQIPDFPGFPDFPDFQISVAGVKDGLGVCLKPYVKQHCLLRQQE